MGRLDCPTCGTRYPSWKLLLQTGWRMRCPSCHARLRFAADKRGMLAGLIGGLTFGCILIAIDSTDLWSWRIMPAFLLFAYLYGGILMLFLGTIEAGAPSWSQDPCPNRPPVFRLFSSVGLVGMISAALVGLLWRAPSGRTMAVFGLVLCISWLCIILGLLGLLFAKGGLLRRERRVPEGPLWQSVRLPKRRISLSDMIIVALFVTNLIALGLFLKVQMWDLWSLRNELWVQATSKGSYWAEHDFREGKLRVLRLVPVDQGKFEPTGEREGPFEVWTWTYVEGVPGSKEAEQTAVAHYNGRMRALYRSSAPSPKGQTKPSSRSSGEPNDR